MWDVNYSSLLLIVIINGFSAMILYPKLKGIKRVYFLFSAVSIFVYSGIGVSIFANDFLAQYLIFSTVYVFTLYFVMLDKKNKCNQKGFNSVSLLLNKKSGLEWFVNVGTFLFLLTYVICLLVPEMRLSQLWNPPSPLLIGKFDRIATQQSHVLLNLTNTLRIVLLPFFMIKLYIWKLRRKIVKGLSFILLWLYLDFLSVLYIGRYEMVVGMIFIVFYILADNQTLLLKKKHFLLIGIGFIVSLPFLASYQFSRLGASVGDLSFADSLRILSGEISFPKYYEVAVEIANFVSPIKYLLWFIVLPIPFISDKSRVSLLVNRVFSEYILGIEYGAKGYYVLLPSILGEAIIIYNEYFYWVHAIFLAFLVGSLCKLLLKNRELSVLNLYFSARIVSIGRGGSQGFFGIVINSLIVYLSLKYLAKGMHIRRVSEAQKGTVT